MTSLVRTKQGDISLEDAITLEDLIHGNYQLRSIEEVLNIPQVMVDQKTSFKVKNGCKIENLWNIQEKVLIKDLENNLLGIYEVEGNLLKVWKNFSQEKWE